MDERRRRHRVMIIVHLLMYQVVKSRVTICDHCAVAIEGGIWVKCIMEAIEAARWVIERCAMMQLIAKVVVNGMLTNEARGTTACAAHFMRH